MTVLLKFALIAAIAVFYAALLVNTVIPETEYSGLRHTDRLAASITSAMAPYIAFPIG